MFVKIFFLLVALNIVTYVAQARADDMAKQLDAAMLSSMGIESANSSNTHDLSRSECIRRALRMLSNQWLKGLVGIQQNAAEQKHGTGIGSFFREADYDLRLSGSDVMLNMSYRF